ncbi:MAG: sigma-70 family RNA polymerase sigma factor [Planctomycetes bacterium]|nr:sigma-70 family RNA polymerase sigma factor [Planctomycetota bacterium]
MRGTETTIGGSKWEFPNTMWSIILNAKDKNSKSYNETLGQLITLYWKPVYKYIRLTWKKSNEEAKDLTQEFFREFLERDFLRPVEPSKGRFRTFVKHSLKCFLINMHKKSHTQKSGGKSHPVSVEELPIDPADDSNITDPVESFDKEWAKTVIVRSIKTLKTKLAEDGKEVYFKVFENYDLNNSEDLNPTYINIAEKLGIKDSDVRNYLVHARRELRKILKKEISEYVLDKSEIDNELKFLLSIRF